MLVLGEAGLPTYSASSASPAALCLCIVLSFRSIAEALSWAQSGFELLGGGLGYSFRCLGHRWYPNQYYKVGQCATPDTAGASLQPPAPLKSEDTQSSRSRRFEVLPVNARDAKHVPGRKSDVSVAEWLQRLHEYGLLRGSFRPQGETLLQIVQRSFTIPLQTWGGPYIEPPTFRL